MREKVWLENSLSQNFSLVDTPTIPKFNNSTPKKKLPNSAPTGLIVFNP